MRNTFLLPVATALVSACAAVATMCPPSTAYVASSSSSDAFCIDQYEASVVDRDTGLPCSPNYNPNTDQAQWQWNHFVNLTPPAPQSRYPMPPRMAEYSLGAKFNPKAVSVRGAQPQAYVDRPNAVLACTNAGKRLCTGAEWRAACKGTRNTTYSYGSVYVAGICNAGVPYWPPGLLNRSNNWEMLDPRIGPLAYPHANDFSHDVSADTPSFPMRGATGSDFPRCSNELKVFDLVGNLAEIVSDQPMGPELMVFVGGNYDRDLSAVTCDRVVDVHAAVYNDYSIGFRCCADPSSSLRKNE